MHEPAASGEPATRGEPAPAHDARLPLTVWALGFTSLLTDVGSEMIFPLLPAFLASLGAGPTFLGLVEGLADATASFFKLGAGYVADRSTRKKPFVIFGYTLAALMRPLMAMVAAPWQVLAVRLADRVGKGVRSAPRDVLIANAVPAERAGRAYGLHRAMDHAGAVFGPLCATGLLGLGLPVRHVFAAALVPGVLAVIMLRFVRESAPVAARAPEQAAARAEAAAAARAVPLPTAFFRYLAVLALFSMGASSDAFLLVRARELGVAVALLPMLWTVLHVSKVASSYLGGAWSDRVPRARLITLGWAIYALSYLGFGMARAAWQVWPLFVVYGIYYGLSEPTEKAIVRDLAPRAAQGRAFGLYNFVVGFSAVPAGLITGFVWERVGPQAALGLGAALAGAASVALLLLGSSLQRS